MIILFLLGVIIARPYFLNKKKFKCCRCGECCKLRVLLTKEEIEAIKKAGYSDFVDKDGWIKKKDKHCIFLKFKEGISYCKIEKIKPKICKDFPEKKGLFGKYRDIRCKTCVGRLW